MNYVFQIIMVIFIIFHGYFIQCSEFTLVLFPWVNSGSVQELYMMLDTKHDLLNAIKVP